MKEFRTISENAEAEIEEKKSRFIANAYYVENEEQVKDYIKKVKKKYHDAKHHCFAYKIIEGERSSDDGEPTGTAGIPILNVISGENLTNVLIIVTRYFGGTLLGTGGLVRAYTEASKKVLGKTKKTEKVLGQEIKIELEYTELNGFKYYAKQNKIKIANIVYSEKVEIDIEIPKLLKQNLLESDNKNGFKINKYELLKEKYIDN